MRRSKKVIFACHCLLNQNARADTVAKCGGVCLEFIQYCFKNDYGIVPIDCPQLEYEPLKRPPATKKNYQNEEMITICKKIIKKVIREIKIYLKNDYQVKGIFGIEGSPSCGATRTHILSKDGKSVGSLESGVFIEELIKALKNNKLKIDIFDWDIQDKKPIKFKNNI